MKRAEGISPARCILTSVLLLSSLVILSNLSHGEAIPNKKALSGFPKKIGQWVGTVHFFAPEVYKVLGVNDSTLIDYQGTKGRNVQLYVGYYQSQRKGDLIHSPKHCLPGAGWTITRTSLVKLTPVGGHPAKMKAIKLLLKKGDDRQVVLYWFQSRGRYIDSEYMQKVYLVWDAITKDRTDGAFVRFIAPVGPKGIGYTTAYLKTFAERVVPILNKYLPGEKA